MPIAVLIAIGAAVVVVNLGLAEMREMQNRKVLIIEAVPSLASDTYEVFVGLPLPPMVSSDDRTLYFSSSPGPGGVDVLG